MGVGQPKNVETWKPRQLPKPVQVLHVYVCVCGQPTKLETWKTSKTQTSFKFCMWEGGTQEVTNPDNLENLDHFQVFGKPRQSQPGKSEPWNTSKTWTISKFCNLETQKVKNPDNFQNVDNLEVLHIRGGGGNPESQITSKFYTEGGTQKVRNLENFQNLDNFPVFGKPIKSKTQKVGNLDNFQVLCARSKNLETRKVGNPDKSVTSSPQQFQRKRLIIT